MRTAVFINYKSLVSSEYKIDIFKIPNIITDRLFSSTGKEHEISKVLVFMNKPHNDHQASFVDIMISNKMDVFINDHKENGQKDIEINMACSLVSMAHENAFDTAAIISGDADLIPAVKEVRRKGKKVMVAYFSDKISKTYKEPNIQTGPIDDLFFLDSVLDQITIPVISESITIDSVIEEMRSEFFDGNIDYNTIKLKKFITYWATRARYLQSQSDDLDKDQKDILKKVFDKLNSLSNDHKPGFIKALNKSWVPDDSWESEVKRIPKSW